MPDRVIKHINFLCKKTSKEQFPSKLEYLNRMKNKYDWDGDEAKFDEALVEDVVRPDIPTELPGVEYEQDMEDSAIQEAVPSTEEVDATEITGVDLEISTGVPAPAAVTDNKQDDDKDSEGDNDSATDDAVSEDHDSTTGNSMRKMTTLLLAMTKIRIGGTLKGIERREMSL